MPNDFDDLNSLMNDISNELDKIGDVLQKASGQPEALKIASNELNIKTFSEGAMLNDVPFADNPQDAIGPDDLKKVESGIVIDLEILSQGIVKKIEEAAK